MTTPDPMADEPISTSTIASSTSFFQKDVNKAAYHSVRLETTLDGKNKSVNLQQLRQALMKTIKMTDPTCILKSLNGVEEISNPTPAEFETDMKKYCHHHVRDTYSGKRLIVIFNIWGTHSIKALKSAPEFNEYLRANNLWISKNFFPNDARLSHIGVIYDKGTRCLLYTSPSPRDQRGSRMPSSA